MNLFFVDFFNILSYLQRQPSQRRVPYPLRYDRERGGDPRHQVSNQAAGVVLGQPPYHGQVRQPEGAARRLATPGKAGPVSLPPQGDRLFVLFLKNNITL